jgi:membrane protein
MTALLERMVAVGWVGRVQPEPGAQALFPWGVREGADNWVLLLDPARIRLADVYRLFVFGGFTAAGGGMGAEPPVSPLALDSEALARQVECAVEEGLDATLAAHFAPQAVAGGRAVQTSAEV